jgi:hypothetical protein
MATNEGDMRTVWPFKLNPMYRFFAFLVCAFALSGCLEDDCQEEILYTAYTPIVAEAANWRAASFALGEPSEDVCDPSGFYVYGDILFVVDRSTGLHIIDNRDNAAPRPLAFMSVPGGEGIAARNNMLYLSQYGDLLTFDISNPGEPRFLTRTEEVFPYSHFADGQPGDVIIGYAESQESYSLDCNAPYYGHGYWFDGSRVLVNSINAEFALGVVPTVTGGVAGAPQPETVGQGGSLARFTISKQTLYVVDERSLRTFSLEKPAEPEFVNTAHIGWGIETIFPSGDNLYIGAETGMHIFGIGQDPNSPEFLSTFQHVRSCDPVVVSGDLAYVTLWGGSNCGDQGDRLMVVDVSDPRRPTLVQDLPQSNSHGLGLTDDHLYLCSGPEGMNVFALAADGTVGDLVHTAGGFPAKDVIVRADRKEAIVFGWEQAGIRQYDLLAGGELSQQSELAICD